MDIILVSRRHGSSTHIPRWLGKLVLPTFVVLLGSAFYGGYRVGAPIHEMALSRDAMSQWESEIQSQKAEVEKVSRLTYEQLDALTVRVAELQARLTRVDALGERLVEVAGLQDGEFDFTMVPGVGGPELSSEGMAYRPPSFTEALDQLDEHIVSRSYQLSILESVLQNRNIDAQTFVAGRPVGSGSWMSSRFGYRTDPFTGRITWHNGLDFAGRQGIDVMSVASGVVVYSGDRGGYGNTVDINHGGGYVTRYAHNKELLVNVGDIVEKGQPIAALGSTGRSTAPHVHFEVFLNGRAVDPAPYITRRMN